LSKGESVENIDNSHFVEEKIKASALDNVIYEKVSQLK